MVVRNGRRGRLRDRRGGQDGRRLRRHRCGLDRGRLAGSRPGLAILSLRRFAPVAVHGRGLAARRRARALAAAATARRTLAAAARAAGGLGIGLVGLGTRGRIGRALGRLDRRRHGAQRRLAANPGRRAARAVAVDIGARLLLAPDVQEAARLRFVQQVAEGAEAVVRLVEIGPAALERVLQGRSPYLAAVAAFGHQRLEGLDHHVHRLGLARLQLFLAAALFIGRAALAGIAAAAVVAAGIGGALAFAGQVVIEDEFVAVGDQQVRGGLLDPHPDHLLVVLAQLGHQRREIGIAADDDEGVDVRLGVAEVQRVHHQPDVGRVLARLAHVRDFDQLEIGLVHRRLEFLVALPVAIGLLDHDAALEQQALQHRPDVELLVLGVAHAKRHVLEVAKKRHADVFVGCIHKCFSVAAAIPAAWPGRLAAFCRP
ncbi:hypothetical protein LMG26846_05644 [Achromobacter insuavis]|nr:hypothetical protein LMG26846_05644 [Achromobacter insuavis]